MQNNWLQKNNRGFVRGVLVVVVAIFGLIALDIVPQSYFERLTNPEFYTKLFSQLSSLYQTHLADILDYWIIDPAYVIWENLIVASILDPITAFLRSIL